MLGGLAIAAALVSIPAKVSAQDVPAAAAAGVGTDGVEVAWTITQDWQTGFSAELTISNHASWAIANWSLAFRFAPEITSIWNARVISRDGGSYVVGPVDAQWDDGEIGPGETLTIGLVAAGPRARPSTGTLNESPIVFGGSAPAPRPRALTLVRPLAWPERVFAPYVDATAWPPPDLRQTSANFSVRHFRVGFVVAKSANDPTPTWGGVQSVDATFLVREINALRLDGGDVAVAFGGASGVELAAAAKSAPELAAAYESVIGRYGAIVADFDLEGAALADARVVELRSAALAALQRWLRDERRPLEIWLTLPLSPAGLSAEGVAAVRSALAHGVELAGVNGMAMDFGPAAAPDPRGRMGSYAIRATRGLEEQVTRIAAGSGVTPAPRIGVTAMIGQNDVAGEVLTQGDARELVDYASASGTALLSFWSLNRDRACGTVGATTHDAVGVATAGPSCSGIDQAAGEFTRLFRAFPSSPASRTTR